jgi:hypothetical protein
VSGVVGLVVAGLVAWAVVRVLNPPAPVIPAEKWQPLEVADRVKVLMPGPSQLVMQQGAGMVTKTHMCQLDPDTAYGVSYSDTALPAFVQNPADRLLDDACNGATANVKQLNGDEISRKAIELGPFPGKEIVHRVGKGNSSKMTTRYYLAHGRLYVVQAQGKGLDPDHENFRRFFDSFEIIEQPAPPPLVVNLPPPVNDPPVNDPPIVQQPQPQPPPQPEGPPAGAHAQIVLPRGSGTILAIRYTPDGQTLVVATSIEQVFWYDANTRALQKRTPERKDRANAPHADGCAISHQGDKAAFSYHGGQLAVIDRGNLDGDLVLSVNQGNNWSHHKPAFSPDGKLLCIEFGNTLRVWDLETKQKRHELDTLGMPGSVVFAPDQSLFLGSSPDLHVLNGKTFQELTREKSPNPFAFVALAFSADSRMLAGGNDTSVFVYTVEQDKGSVKLTNNRVLRYLTGHVIAVAFSSGSRLVVAAGDDRQVKCWNTENGLSRESFDLQVPGLGVPNTLAVRQKDHQLAVGCGDRVLFFSLPRFKDER